MLTTVVFIFLPSLNLTKMKKLKHRNHQSSKFAEIISESEIDVRIVDRVLANTNMLNSIRYAHPSIKIEQRCQTAAVGIRRAYF